MSVWWILWVAVVAVLAWQVRRAIREPLERDRIIAEASAGITPAAADNRAGADAALLDECELIYSRPRFDLDLNAGCDRLWDAILDHREDEDR